jgi:hypothetical protein
MKNFTYGNVKFAKLWKLRQQKYIFNPGIFSPGICSFFPVLTMNLIWNINTVFTIIDEKIQETGELIEVILVKKHLINAPFVRHVVVQSYICGFPL